MGNAELPTTRHRAPSNGRIGSRVRPWLGTGLSVAVLAGVLLTVDLDAVRSALASVRPWHVLAGVALLLLRDGYAEVARWQAVLRWAGHGTRFRAIFRVYLDFVPLKFLLPFKMGDAARVLALRQVCGVPLFWGTTTRLSSMALQMAVLVGCCALFVALDRGRAWPLLAGAALLATLALAAAWWLRRRRPPAPEPANTPSRGGAPPDRAETSVRRWRHGVTALALAGLSVALDLTLYMLVVGALTGIGPSWAVLAVVAATVLACNLPLSSRGIGIRELALTTAAAGVGLGTKPALLGAGLVISGIEVAVVLVLAMGLVAGKLARLTGTGSGPRAR